MSETVPLLQSVRRALDVIEALERARDGIGVTALARQLNLTVSTTHNILKVLRQRGYVDQQPDSSDYSLGTRLIILGNRAATHSDLIRAAREPLKALHQFCGESVFLASRRRTTMEVLITIPGIRLLSVSSSTRPEGTLHCTAMGKAILAYMTPEERAHWIAESGMEQYTEHTITDPVLLDEELAIVRQRGYAQNTGEESQGVIGVGAPVWDHRGSVMAAISVGYPADNWPEGVLPRIADEIVRCSREISTRLGYVVPDAVSPQMLSHPD